MTKSQKPIVELAYMWMGHKFILVKLERGLKRAMRNRVTTSAKFDFRYRYVVVYAIGYPCEVHRLAAVANSYNISPDITIDAISD